MPIKRRYDRYKAIRKLDHVPPHLRGMVDAAGATGDLTAGVAKLVGEGLGHNGSANASRRIKAMDDLAMFALEHRDLLASKHSATGAARVLKVSGDKRTEGTLAKLIQRLRRLSRK